MPFLIAITSIVFVYIGFIARPQTNNVIFPIYGYYVQEAAFIIRHYVASGFGLIVLVIVLRLYLKFDRRYSFSKKILFAVLQSMQVVLIAFLLSYIILLFVAFSELNILSVLANFSVQTIGLETDKAVISNFLKNDSAPPQIFTANKEKEKIVLAVAISSSGTGNLYGNYVLPSIPGFFVLPFKNPGAGILLANNTLIISDISAQDLSKISPYLAYLFIRQYFQTRNIKAYPMVDIISDKEYLKYRQEDIAVKLKKIDVEIKNSQNLTSSISASLKQEEESIADNQTLIKSLYKRRDSDYGKCLSAGRYVSGVLQHFYSREDCQKIQDNYDAKIAEADSSITNLEQKHKSDQDQLDQASYLNEFFKTQKTVIQSSGANIPFETGVFRSPNTIKLVYDRVATHGFTDFLETLTHEYLHYAAYYDNRSFESTFFEEGFAEYFARRAIKDVLNTDTNLGYPAQVKIIEQITKLIPETELAEIYFSKDQKGLEAALDRVYGEGFYKNNRIFFETLQYSSDLKQTLFLANYIMEKIGGFPLSEKDLLSSFGN